SCLQQTPAMLIMRIYILDQKLPAEEGHLPENQDTSYIPTPHESTKMLILVRISLPGRFTLTRGCSMKAMRALIKQDLVALVKLRVGTLTMRTLKAVIQ